MSYLVYLLIQKLISYSSLESVKRVVLSGSVRNSVRNFEFEHKYLNPFIIRAFKPDPLKARACDRIARPDCG